MVESGGKIDKLTPLLVLSRDAVTLKVNTSIKIEVLEIAAGDSVEKWESSNEGIASVSYGIILSFSVSLFLAAALFLVCFFRTTGRIGAKA